ncbi:hypothetical protein DV737_g1290, partial [Chaetothyriales sp. CBS 132003]
MSVSSFAAFRPNQGDELFKLAEEHFKHDLEESDRQALKNAASKFSTYAAVGSAIGLGLGAFLAFRVRAARRQVFAAFKATEKPTFVKFADGREEAIPDITPLLAPTTLGDIAAFTFFPLGGLFLFGETGALAGSWSARKGITSNPESKKRIERAFANFRIDILKKEIAELEKDKVADFLGVS